MRIENSERGITITKSLAWTILLAIGSGGLWLGTQMATVKSEIKTVGEQATNAARARTALEARLRVVEVSDADTRAQMRYMSSSITEIKDTQREILDLLRAADH